MSLPPFFSVIIPTYNRDYCLSNAVQSVLDQTFNDFELIVIDDNSTDKTEEVVKSFRDGRIKYQRLDKNIGQSGANNVGIQRSKGRFIAFLDSDDIWENTFLATFHNSIAENPRYKCFYCWLKNEQEQIFKEWDLEGDIYKQGLIQGHISSTITLVVESGALKKSGGFSEQISYGNDDDLCFRLAKHHQFKLIRKALAISRELAKNRTTKNNYSLCLGKYKLLSKFKDDVQRYCGEVCLKEKYRDIARDYVRCGQYKKAQFCYATSMAGNTFTKSNILIKLLVKAQVVIFVLRIKKENLWLKK